jgi:hypothetical protein
MSILTPSSVGSGMERPESCASFPGQDEVYIVGYAFESVSVESHAARDGIRDAVSIQELGDLLCGSLHVRFAVEEPLRLLGGSPEETFPLPFRLRPVLLGGRLGC